MLSANAPHSHNKGTIATHGQVASLPESQVFSADVTRDMLLLDSLVLHNCTDCLLVQGLCDIQMFLPRSAVLVILTLLPRNQFYPLCGHINATLVEHE